MPDETKLFVGHTCLNSVSSVPPINKPLLLCAICRRILLVSWLAAAVLRPSVMSFLHFTVGQCREVTKEGPFAPVAVTGPFSSSSPGAPRFLLLPTRRRRYREQPGLLPRRGTMWPSPAL